MWKKTGFEFAGGLRGKSRPSDNPRVPGNVTILADELQVFYIEATIAPEPAETPTPSPTETPIPTETPTSPTVTPEPTPTPLQPLGSDGDGFADDFERAHNSDPNDPTSVPMALDLDGDGKLTAKDAMIHYRNRLGLIPVENTIFRGNDGHSIHRSTEPPNHRST